MMMPAMVLAVKLCIYVFMYMLSLRVRESNAAAALCTSQCRIITGFMQPQSKRRWV
jgi:hypothetical protein